MEYALLIYGDEKVWASRDEEQGRDNNVRHERFAGMLARRDAMRGGKQLALASSATTLRHSDGDVSITDGPFAETAEVFGGFYLIEAADLDAAIALAKELPEGVVEIRPIVPMAESGS
ncbi:YciI family protein [Amycolatopsis sp.]|uniref:YciI family protein n=1 Tax=Amycolatopsis sp. TaxID=37632 RepID=UPI002E058CFA|nr:YciI family protein [Amycolatopsis sp.]